jgi:hypothetical protein
MEACSTRAESVQVVDCAENEKQGSHWESRLLGPKGVLTGSRTSSSHGSWGKWCTYEFAGKAPGCPRPNR